MLAALARSRRSWPTMPPWSSSTPPARPSATTPSSCAAADPALWRHRPHLLQTRYTRPASARTRGPLPNEPSLKSSPRRRSPVGRKRQVRHRRRRAAARGRRPLLPCASSNKPTCTPPPPVPSTSASTVATNNPLLDDIPPPPPPDVQPEGGQAERRLRARRARAAGARASASAGLRPAELGQALQVRANQARRCYNAALAQDPSLKGHVSIAVRVGPARQRLLRLGCLQRHGLADRWPTARPTSSARAATRRPTGGCVDANVPLSFVPMGGQ